LQKLVFSKCIFGKGKTGFGIAMEKCGMRDSREKGAGMRDQPTEMRNERGHSDEKK